MEFHSGSIQNLRSAKLPSWVLYLLYAAAYLCVLPFFQHQTDVDTIGYIAAAEQYAAGHFSGGINGYWSPLLSWLLVPLILLKIPALLAIKLIDLIAALIGLWLIDLLTRQLGFSKFYARICMLVAMPHLAMFSLCVSTPDVLACVSWLAVAYYALQLYSNPEFSAVLKLSLAGTISYFAKYYHFYAFILLIIVFMIMKLLQQHKYIAVSYMKAIVVFLLLSSAWMYLLYLKHGVFSPTTAAAHNIYTSQHPEAVNDPQVGKNILPLDYTKYQYTAWEYVPDYAKLIHSENEHQKFDIETRGSLVLKNLFKGSRYFYIETLLFLVAIIFLLRAGVFRTNKMLFPFLLIILLYPLGYYVTTVDYRYLLFCVLAIIILGGAALQYTEALFPRSVISILLIGSFLLPIHRINRFEHKGEAYFEMNNYFNASGRLKGKHILSSPQAWSRAIGLCYQSKAKYYDTLIPEKITAANPELKHYSISYYLCFANEVTEEMKHSDTIVYYNKYALVQLVNE